MPNPQTPREIMNSLCNTLVNPDYKDHVDQALAQLQLWIGSYMDKGALRRSDHNQALQTLIDEMKEKEEVMKEKEIEKIVNNTLLNMPKPVYSGSGSMLTVSIGKLIAKAFTEKIRDELEACRDANAQKKKEIIDLRADILTLQSTLKRYQTALDDIHSGCCAIIEERKR